MLPACRAALATRHQANLTPHADSISTMAACASAAVIGSPMRFTETPVTYRHAPPTVGQHTEEVLREKLGLVDEDLATLRDKEVL